MSSRVVFGTRLSPAVGLLVVGASGTIGALLGLNGRDLIRVERILMRLLDGMMAFPAILLALALVASLGPRLSNLVIALSIVYIPGIARVVRGVVLVAREQAFVESSLAAGASEGRILVRHILPNCLPPLVVQCTFVFAQSILIEAALSFLGVGIPPYLPGSGNIMSEGRTLLHVAPWLTFFPGTATMVTVLGYRKSDGRSTCRRPWFAFPPGSQSCEQQLAQGYDSAEEFTYVLSGRVTLFLGDDVVELQTFLQNLETCPPWIVAQSERVYRPLIGLNGQFTSRLLP